jgi:protein SCO1
MRLRLICFGLAVTLVLLGNVHCLEQGPMADADTRQGGQQDTAYRGGLVTPPLPKPEFTLTDTAGRPFDFRVKTDGYVTLLFFGYTQCASVCPMQMATLAAAMKKLPSGVRDRIKVVFVTTDPAHDNPTALRTWLGHFDKSFIGLTGTEAGVKAAQMAAKVPSGGPAEHAAFVLAYSKDNRGHLIYPDGITQGDWLHDLPQLASEAWTQH